MKILKTFCIILISNFTVNFNVCAVNKINNEKSPGLDLSTFSNTYLENTSATTKDNYHSDPELREGLNKLVGDYAKVGFLNAVFRVSRDNKILFQGARGYADFEKKKLLTLNAHMPIASVTKQITAAGILLLEEQNKLSVHDVISKHIGKSDILWSGKMPEWANKITLHQLLTHTHGIPEYIARCQFLRTDGLKGAVSKIFAHISSTPLDENTGEFNYNNSGYTILGVIIEKLSGQSLDEFYRQNFFNKLGMKNTRLIKYEEAIDFQKGKIEDFPSWYFAIPTNHDPIMKPVRVKFYIIPFSEGGLLSTVQDLEVWMDSLMSGKILSASSLKKMLGKHVPTKRKFLHSSKVSYGYGIYVTNDTAGNPVYFHPGSALGIRSELTYLEGCKSSIAIISNVNIYVPQDKKDMIDMKNPKNQLDISYFEQKIADHMVANR